MYGRTFSRAPLLYSDTSTTVLTSRKRFQKLSQVKALDSRVLGILGEYFKKSIEDGIKVYFYSYTM